MIIRLAALVAAVTLACTAASAQLDTRTLPLASPLTGAERTGGVQGSGCPAKAQPCANVAVTPDLIRTYLLPTFQAKDADLDAIAALTTTGFGRGLLTQADAVAVRSSLGLGSLATQSGTFSGSSSGTNTGDQASVSGNAGTATKLATARAINGVAFDGSAAITINAVDATTRLAAANNLSDVTNTASARANLLLGSVATQSFSSIYITGGIIDGTGIGTTSPNVGYFSTLRVTSADQSTARMRITNTASGGRAYEIVSGVPGASQTGFSVFDTTSGAVRIVLDDGAGNAMPGADNSQALGGTTSRWSAAYARQFRPGSGAPIWTSGSGTPLGNVTAPVGSLYTRTDGAAGATFYVKESGADASGWVAK